MSKLLRKIKERISHLKTEGLRNDVNDSLYFLMHYQGIHIECAHNKDCVRALGYLGITVTFESFDKECQLPLSPRRIYKLYKCHGW
jgi:hypothetical protein